MAIRGLVLIIFGVTWEAVLGVDPEVFMNSTGLIVSKGYPCENHKVVTKDGFILTMQRIPHGRHENGLNSGRPAVMLQHGLLGSSSNFLDNLANESLAYILADAGADVWLGNVRGNMYSREHTTMKPSHKDFWRWSYDEMAKYDLPAMVDYIVKATQQPQIYYVGHSQGTMIGFAGFSQNKTLGKQIKTFMALAPVAKVGHIDGPLRKIAPYANDLLVFEELFGHGEFAPSSEITTWLAEGFCNWDKEFCESFFFVLGGHDKAAMNESRIPVYVAHNPAGTSVRNIMHFAQGVNHDQFMMFDFGSAAANREHYGQDTPPKYQPNQLAVPTVMFTGGNDYMADPTDVSWLKAQVNKTLLADHFIQAWEHMDFIWAMDAPKLAYDEIKKIVLS